MEVDSKEAGDWSGLMGRNSRMEHGLKEAARRLQHLRNELSGRLSGDAATKFFGVTDATISIIEDALK